MAGERLDPYPNEGRTAVLPKGLYRPQEPAAAPAQNSPPSPYTLPPCSFLYRAGQSNHPNHMHAKPADIHAAPQLHVFLLERRCPLASRQVARTSDTSVSPKAEVLLPFAWCPSGRPVVAPGRAAQSSAFNATSNAVTLVYVATHQVDTRFQWAAASRVSTKRANIVARTVSQVP